MQLNIFGQQKVQNDSTYLKLNFFCNNVKVFTSVKCNAPLKNKINNYFKKTNNHKLLNCSFWTEYQRLDLYQLYKQHKKTLTMTHSIEFCSLITFSL